MTVVKISDAASMLSELVRRAASGEEVLLAHNGQTIARLSAIGVDESAEKHRAAIDRLKNLSEGQSLGGLSIKDLLSEGRI